MGRLAEDLQEAGYWTLGVVSNESLFRPGGYDQGFDEWVGVGLAKPGEVLNIFQASPIRTVKHVNDDALEALAKRPRDRFFLYLDYIDVHPEQGEYAPIRGLVVISVASSMGRRNTSITALHRVSNARALRGRLLRWCAALMRTVCEHP